jgi:signal transduction histidine kinase
MQVLINLLSNAIKFSKSNSHVEVNFDTKPLGGNNMELCLLVQDHGVGISPENVERLFMREFDAYEEHRSMNKQGRGLGMFICRKLIEGMGGHIKVESELGKGTAIQVYLTTHYQIAEARAVSTQTIQPVRVPDPP